ncbi:hypothetical protein VCHC17A1_3897B, partial [Vibrio cholerae HC-17A1]
WCGGYNTGSDYSRSYGRGKC